MMLEELVEREGLDPEGLQCYLKELTFARELGRREDPTAIVNVRRAWPSRFRQDNAYQHETHRVRSLLSGVAS